jgi:hypothetical protein
MPVRDVADERVTPGLELDTDLVPAARLERDLEERRFLEPLEDPGRTFKLRGCSTSWSSSRPSSGSTRPSATAR